MFLAQILDASIKFKGGTGYSTALFSSWKFLENDTVALSLLFDN